MLMTSDVSNSFSFTKTGINCFRFTERTRLGFLSWEETEEVLKVSRGLLSKKSDRYGAPYVVLVDGDCVECGNTRSLRRVLSECYVDQNRFVVFKNLNGGVTLNLNQPRKLSSEL